MRPLWLDYQRDAPGRRRPGLVLLIFSVLLTAVLLTQYFTIAQELSKTGQRVSQLRHGADHQRMAVDANASATDAAGQRSPAAISTTRWESLFSTLENASNDSMTLLSLEPGQREISIKGEAKDLAAAMDYVQRLQSATVLTHPHLTESQVVKEHPQHPVRFTLLAEWREAPR